MVFGWFQKSAEGGGKAHAGEPFPDTSIDPSQRPVAPAFSSTDLLRQHRNHLYDTIRECMIVSGILSSGYKFKVLSADSTHMQFMVLFDLNSEYATDTHRLCEIEALIQSSAQRRYGISVKTCYWHVLPTPELLAQSTLLNPQAAKPAPSTEETKAQLNALLDSQEHPASAEAGFAPTQFSNSGMPTQEVATSYVMLTGYEDTEMAQSQFRPTQLSDKP